MPLGKRILAVVALIGAALEDKKQALTQDQSQPAETLRP
jgi:hypothetical protein